MTFRLLPKDVRFFELFTAFGENLRDAAHALQEMVDVYDRREERVTRLAERLRQALR